MHADRDSRGGANRHQLPVHPRPWRRVGTVLCVFISVMFLAGLLWLDPKQKPITFLAYWAIILLLLLWLCALAIRDILFTRKLIAEWKAARNAEMAEKLQADGDGEQQ